jgi:hypothetical protein
MNRASASAAIVHVLIFLVAAPIEPVPLALLGVLAVAAEADVVHPQRQLDEVGQGGDGVLEISWLTRRGRPGRAPVAEDAARQRRPARHGGGLVRLGPSLSVPEVGRMSPLLDPAMGRVLRQRASREDLQRRKTRGGGGGRRDERRSRRPGERRKRGRGEWGPRFGVE